MAGSLISEIHFPIYLQNSSQIFSRASHTRMIMADPIEEVPELVEAELSPEEAAAKLGCQVGTVKSRVSRARALLADTLSVTFESEPHV